MRAAIFIDGAYILTHLKQHNLTPNYKDLADYLLKPLRKSVPLDLLRCYFYYCPPWMSTDPTDAEKRRMAEHEIFMEEITSLERWSVRLGKLHRRWDGYKESFEQKRVDVLLSVDMVRHSAAGHIQHAIMVAGDSDFIPAIEATKESGATVSLWCGEEDTVHKDLLHLADIVHRFEWKKFPSKKMKSDENPIAAVQKKVEAYMRERTLKAGNASVNVSGNVGGSASASASGSGSSRNQWRRRPRKKTR